MEYKELISEANKFLKEKGCADSGGEIAEWLVEFVEIQAKNLQQPDVSGSFPLAEISKKAKLELLDGMMEQAVMGMADNEHKQKTIEWLQSEINYLNGNDR